MTRSRPSHTCRFVAAGCVVLALGWAAPSAAQLGPAPTSSGLSPDVLALACAPMPAFGVPDAPLRITGNQDGAPHQSFVPGDLLVVNGGEKQGIAVGQEFFARRVVTLERSKPTPERPGVVQTSGWIRIYSVGENMSLATATHACDVFAKGDYLEPFTTPVIPATAPKEVGMLRHDAYGHVLAGIEHKTAFGKGDFFILDRGSDDGVTPGMRFVVYRDKHEPGVFLFEVGDAVALSVRRDTATLLITRSRDAMMKGDYVAMQK